MDEPASLNDVYAFTPYIYGQRVRLCRTWLDGDRTIDIMPPLDAAIALQFDERNGGDIMSGHIEFGWLLDGWGGSA